MAQKSLVNNLWRADVVSFTAGKFAQFIFIIMNLNEQSDKQNGARSHENSAHNSGRFWIRDPMMQIEKCRVSHRLAVRCAPCHDMILSQMSECIKAEHHRHPHKCSLRKEEKELITFLQPSAMHKHIEVVSQDDLYLWRWLETIFLDKIRSWSSQWWVEFPLRNHKFSFCSFRNDEFPSI